jgi:hypothetical protein
MIRFCFLLAGELNNIDYNYDPRYLIESVRGNQSQTTPTSSSSRYAPNERFKVFFKNLVFSLI